ncbi:MAG: hypothetical protein ACRDSP_13015 [Pseudonocardiaceae bacterium]
MKPQHRTLALALALELALDPDLARDPALARPLARTLALDPDLTRALGLALALDPDLAHALQRAPGPAPAMQRALVRARELERTLHAAAQETAPDGACSAPSRVPRGLVTLATRLLPVRNRPRYAEEFRTEMMDVPGPGRWGYALRVLAAAWNLRRALTETPRIPDDYRPG